MSALCFMHTAEGSAWGHYPKVVIGLNRMMYAFTEVLFERF